MGEPKFRKVLFIDRNAELENSDKEKLEAMGYLVVFIVGDPGKVVHTWIADHF